MKVDVHGLIVVSFILVFIVSLPLSLRAPDIAGPLVNDSGQNPSNDIHTYLSVSSDVVFFITGETSLLTEEFRSWLSFFAFELESNSSLLTLVGRAASARNLMTDASLVLKGYLTGLQRIVMGYNISYYVLNDYSLSLLQNFTTLAESLGGNNATLILSTSMYNSTAEFLRRLPFAIHFVDEVVSWGTILLDIVNSTYEGQGLDQLVSDVRMTLSSDMDRVVKSIFTDQIQAIFTSVYENFGLADPQDAIDLYPLIASDIDQVYTPDDLQLLRDLYDSPQLTIPARMARDRLLNFVRGDFLPIGFDIEILDFLRNSYSNFDGREITSMIVSISLADNLDAEDIETAFLLFKEIRDEYVKRSPVPIEVNILNEEFYVVERNDAFLDNFILLDYLSLIFGLGVLFLFFRSLKIAVIPILIAWPTTYLSRGLVVLILKPFSFVSSGSLSVSSALIFGASLNYTVFFLVRYLEEMEKGKGKKKALEAAKRYSLHSIQISGMAVILTISSLAFSSLIVISQIAASVVVGVSIQLVLLNFLLPSSFELAGGILDGITVRPHVMRLPKISRKSTRKVVILFGLFTILALSIIYLQPGEITGNDLVGGDGEVVRSYRTMEAEFPDTFLSKILVSLEFNESFRDENLQLELRNIPVISTLYDSLSRVRGVSSVYSLMSPLGALVDYSNTSLNYIQLAMVAEIANQFVDRSGNRTFILVQLDTANTLDYPEIVRDVKAIVESTPSLGSGLVYTSVSGLPVLVAEEVEDLFFRTPILISISLILLTIFLWAVLNSVAIPLRLILSIIIGGLFSMAIGITVWLLFFGKPMSLIVIALIIIILLALGTDFDIYLYNRISEEYSADRDLERSINRAVDVSSIGIELSGIVMAMSFAVLLFSDTSLFVQFGFVIAVAILLDITVIRQWLVPSLLMSFPESTRRGLERRIKKRVESESTKILNAERLSDE